MMIDKRGPQNSKKASVVKKTILGYCLIRLKDGENFLPVFRELEAKKNILECEAVREKSHIVLLLSAPDEIKLKEFYLRELKEKPQFCESEIYPISYSAKGKQPGKDNGDFLSCKEVSAYIQMEIDSSKEKELSREVVKIPGVIFCSVLNHHQGMIVKLRAPSFRKMGELITGSFKPLLGIIRLHQLKIIDLASKLNYPRLNQEVWNFSGEFGQIIPLLQSAQESFGYIPEIAVKYISGVTGRPESELYGVISFYKQFRLRPVGKFLVRLCDGTACHVNNAKMLREVIIDELKLTNDDTTSDGLFTLVPVACLGCCSLAPAMMVNNMTHGRLTPQSIRSILRNYRREGMTQVIPAEVAK